jgi:hypothetical protein
MKTRRGFLAGSLGAIAALSAVGQERPAALRFGVNYVPSKNWWFCWEDWDSLAIADDLRAVADLGLDHVRIQCLWPMIQPGPSYISQVVLARLHDLLDSADRAGLDVQVTVLNGWMSGFSFMPVWVKPLLHGREPDKGNIFVDAEVIEAEKLLFRRIAEAIGGHRRFLGFDIGNELGVLQGINNPVGTAQADAWANQILSHCDGVAPGRFHVNGVDHQHWFADFGFSRENLGTAGHATVVHSYGLFTGAFHHYGGMGAGSLRLAEYMAELAFAYHRDLSRRVWVEETGVAPDEYIPAAGMPEYMERLVRNAVSTKKLWGITWWCSHDFDPAIKGFDRMEYQLGLLDRAGRPKPLGRKFAALAKELRGVSQTGGERTTALVVPDRGLSAKTWPPDWSWATPFMTLAERGKMPSIVLASRATDEDYLGQRGIKELVPLTEAARL